MRIRVINKASNRITKDSFMDFHISISELDAPTYILFMRGLNQRHIYFRYSGEAEPQVKLPLTNGYVIYGRNTGRIFDLSVNDPSDISSLVEIIPNTLGLTPNMLHRFNAGLQIASEIGRNHSG